MKKTILTLAIFALTASFAQGGGGKPPRGGTPPTEAITACEGQEVAATCSMETPRGDIVEGTCENTHDNKYFACKPNDHKERSSK